MSGRIEDKYKTAREKGLLWLRSSMVLATLGYYCKRGRLARKKPPFPNAATPELVYFKKGQQ